MKLPYVRALAAFAIIVILHVESVWAQSLFVPLAILPFHGRPSINSDAAADKEIAATVTELLTIKMLASERVMLVERQEIERILDELKLSRAGVVDPAEATQVGRLTGAKLLISGSVVRIKDDLYLIAKVMGTETSRLIGASVKGTANSKLEDLVEKLAAELDNALSKKMESLLPKVESESDWVAKVKSTLKDRELPTVRVKMVSENGKLDLAAVTELNRLLKEVGFEILSGDHAPDLEITGEAKSEFAYRRGDWVATRCRIDLQVQSPADGKIRVSDSESFMVFDISEQTAGRDGIEGAVRRIVARLTPKLVP
ncbi:MAG: CsgG/HfaB family protein [Planctomycetota bacterium]|jgi:hypothetical protein